MKKVLIVDDSELTRSFHGTILKSAGFIVTYAADGQEGLEKATREMFDLVLTDINMPVLDGFSFVEALRRNQDYDDTPVVIISTGAVDKELPRARDAGADVFIEKPVAPPVIIRTAMSAKRRGSGEDCRRVGS